jgi:hypothetical protein
MTAPDRPDQQQDPAARRLTPLERLKIAQNEALKVKDGYCYFCFVGNVVKIGYSKNWQDRLRTLRTNVPGTIGPFRVIKANRRTEHDLHKRFDHLRQNGEWFDDTACEILAFVDAISGEERIR